MSNTLEARIIADSSGFASEFAKMPKVMSDVASRIIQSLDAIADSVEEITGRFASMGQAASKGASVGFDETTKKSKTVTAAIIADTQKVEKEVIASQERMKQNAAKIARDMHIAMLEGIDKRGAGVEKGNFQSKSDWLTKQGYPLNQNHPMMSTMIDKNLVNEFKKQEELLKTFVVRTLDKTKELVPMWGEKVKSEKEIAHYKEEIAHIMMGDSKVDAEIEKYAQKEMMRLKARGAKTFSQAEQMIDRVGGITPGDVRVLEMYKKEAKDVASVSALLGTQAKSSIVAFMDATTKHAKEAGMSIVEFEKHLRSLNQGKMGGKESAALFKFGRMEGLSGGAVRKLIDDEMKKKPPGKPDQGGGFFQTLIDEAEMSMRFVAYRFGFMGRAIGSTIANSVSAARAAATAGAAAGGSGGGGGILGSLLGGASGGAATVGTIALITGTVVALGVAAVATGLIIGNSLAKSVAHYTESLSDMSAKTAISIESLSALDHVAAMGGLSIQDFQMSLIRFNDKIQESASGNKKMAGVFKDLKIEVKDTETTVKPTLQLLLETADALYKIGPSSKQTALAIDAFGQQGTRLLTIINKGPKAIQELMEEAKKMGLVLSGEGIAASEKYIESQRKISEIMRSLKHQISAEFLPAFANLMESIAGYVNGPTGKAIIGFFTSLAGGIAAVINRMAGDPVQAAKDQVSKSLAEIKRLETAIDNAKAPGMTPKKSVIDEFEGRLFKEKKAYSDARDSIDAYSGSTQRSTKYLDTQSGAIRSNTQTMDKWKDTIDNARHSLQGQITNLKEQEIGMRLGELAAKKFALGEALIEAKQRAIKEGAPAKVIAELEALYKKMTPEILATTEALQKLRGTDFATEIIRRTRELIAGVLGLKNQFVDLTDIVEPGDKALRDFTASMVDMEKSIDEMLITARREEKFGVVEGAAKQVKVLETLLENVRSKMKDPLVSLNEKAFKELVRARELEIEQLQLETIALSAISAEERLQVEITRTLIEQRQKGVILSREDVALQEQLKISVKDRLVFEQAMKTKRGGIEDMLFELKSIAAITKEEQLRISIEKTLLDLKRQGIIVTEEQNRAEYDRIAVMTELEQKVGDIIKRQQETIDTIKTALDSAIENMQSAFSDMWYNIFNPKEGESWGKNFLRSVADGWLKSLSQISGVMMSGLMNELFKSMNEEGLGFSALIMKLLKSAGIGKLNEKDAAVVAGASGILGKDAAAGEVGIPLFDSAVNRFAAAVNQFAGGNIGGIDRSPILEGDITGLPSTLGEPNVMEWDIFDDYERELSRVGSVSTSSFINDLVSKIPVIGQPLSQALNGPLPAFLSTLGTGLINAVTNFGSWLLKIVQEAMGMMSSMDFSGGGSSGGGIGGWLAGLFTSAAGSNAGANVWGMGYAKGGRTPSLGYSGIIRSPTYSMVRTGENAPKQFEAVVPLPDNRSIPVTFTGGGGSGGGSSMMPGGGDQSPTVIEVHFHNPIDPASMKTSYSELVQTFRKDKKSGGQLTTIIKGVSKS